MLGACGAVAIVLALVTFEINRTAPVRGAVRAYTALVEAANRQDLAAVRELCTPRYLQMRPLARAEEGGLVGLPRNIDKNFQAWRHGANVWLCPTNRVGPVYQFVPDGPRWRFDGPVGLLMPDGQVESSDISDETARPAR